MFAPNSANHRGSVLGDQARLLRDGALSLFGIPDEPHRAERYPRRSSLPLEYPLMPRFALLPTGFFLCPVALA